MDAIGLDNMGGVLSMQLDQSEKYRLIDKEEVQWVYSYQKLGHDEGWFVWMTRPGQIEICVGQATEKEVEDKITHNPPLNQDDLIDLELWMKTGGLDQFQPRKEKQ